MRAIVRLPPCLAGPEAAFEPSLPLPPQAATVAATAARIRIPLQLTRMSPPRRVASLLRTVYNTQAPMSRPLDPLSEPAVPAGHKLPPRTGADSLAAPIIRGERAPGEGLRQPPPPRPGRRTRLSAPRGTP